MVILENSGGRGRDAVSPEKTASSHESSPAARGGVLLSVPIMTAAE